MLKSRKLSTTVGYTLILLCFVILSAVVSAEPGFELLTGKWMRPDGGYMIEIREVRSDGKLAAGYFNPRPIHVEKAQTFHKEGKLEVFIELQDINYPGSTYRLVYNHEKDLLEGVYFQAKGRIEHQIYFMRIK